MKYRILPIIGILLATVLAMPAHAAFFQQGDTVTIAVPVSDNLYVAGSNVTVQNSVAGDAIAVGGNVRIQGRIGNTLQAAGGQVSVLAPVQKSARLAGGTVTVAAPIGSDLIVAGGQVFVESGTVIEGDMIVFGGSVTMDGRVKGELRAFGGQIVIGGRVDGPMQINAENVTLNGTFNSDAILAANTLSIGTNAAFTNTIRYWTEKGQMDFGTALQGANASASFDAALARTSASQAYETANKTSAAIVTFFSVYSLLTAALLLLLFLLLARPGLQHAGDRLMQAPWWSLLVGFLYVVVTPIGIVLLLITIIGIPVAFFLLFLYVFSWVFGAVITAILFTRLIEAWNRKSWSFGIFYLVSVLMIVALKVLMLIPIVGWLTRGVLLCMAFGALISTVVTHWKRIAPRRSAA